ncbi:MAG: AI-2E family transporter [Deltaproteobacteria bacterium]|nr:AI-2E family transporter [Deltaproteobacteria bacterium]
MPSKGMSVNPGLHRKRGRAAVEASISASHQRRPLIVAAGLVLLVTCLYWAQAVLIPVALAILLTFLLSPLTTALEKIGLGRAPSVVLVILLTFLVLTTIGWIGASQITTLASELPDYRHNIMQKIRDLRSMVKGGALEKVQETVEEVKEEIDRSQPASTASKPLPVVIQPDSWRSLYVGPLVQPLASAALVFGLLIFMLAQREELRNRLIRVIGYGKLTVTTRAMEDAGRRISRYLLMQITINSCFGVIIATALFLIGLPYAFLWGLLAIPLLFIPVVGFWAATALPTILSLAVFRDWWWPLVVIALFFVLKSGINMLLEPLLYGRNVGVSQVPLLVMIAFWTWLWGPIGLLLATPLTVCLVVFAKHFPQLEFIQVLLSDEPVMETRISYYQRLLAMDRAEAETIIKDYLRKNPLEQLYSEVLLPAFTYAKKDRLRGNLEEREARFVVNTTREILDTLADAELQFQNDSPLPSGETSLPKIRILGCPAHDSADEVGLMMLRQLLGSTCEMEVISVETLASEVISRVEDGRPPVVCIVALPPGGLAQARYLCKRLRALSLPLKIIVGRWGLRAHSEESSSALRSAGADQLGTTLLQTRDQILNLRQLLSGAPFSSEGGKTLVTSTTG